MKKQKERPNKLFAVAADNWKNDVLPLSKRSSYRSTCYLVTALVDEFGYKNIQDITKADIQRYIVQLSTRVGLESIRHYLTTFRGIMEYADDEWDMPTRLKLPKKKRTKQEQYTFEEVRKLLTYSSGTVKVLIMTLAETGCRIGEALALQKADVLEGRISITKDMYDGSIQDSPKTESSNREVYISERLEKELRTLSLDDPKSFIFRSGSGTRAYWPQQLTGEMRDLCRRARLTYKSPHAFRRGNITALCNDLSIPERIVGTRVGHQSTGMTLGVYNLAQIGCDKVWVEKIEKWLYEGE